MVAAVVIAIITIVIVIILSSRLPPRVSTGAGRNEAVAMVMRMVLDLRARRRWTRWLNKRKRRERRKRIRGG